MSVDEGGLHGGTAPLAALTTIFTPPCATSWLITTTKAPSQYPPFPTNGPASCDPPLWLDNIEDKGFQYYSPAVCPGGFSVGPSCTSVQLPTSEGFPNLESGETVAFCVPSGYSCTSDTTDFQGGIWGVLRTATAAGPQVTVTITVAPALQIRWRDIDLTILETHPLSPGVVVGIGTRPTAAPTTAAAPTPPAGPPPPPPPPPPVETSTTAGPGPSSTTSPPSPPPASSVVSVPPPAGGFSTIRSAAPTPITSLRDTSGPAPPQSSTSQNTDQTTQQTERTAGNGQPSTTTSAPSSPSEAGPGIVASSSASGGKGSGSGSSGVSCGNNDNKMTSPSTPPSSLSQVAVILPTLFLAAILGVGAFLLIRRDRRRNKGLSSPGPLLPVGLGVWANRGARRYPGRGALWRRFRRKIKQHRQNDRNDGFPTRGPGSRHQRLPSDALPIVAAAAPLGTKENPAELDPHGNGDESAAQARWSWVSRMFSIRGWREDLGGHGQNPEDDDGVHCGGPGLANHLSGRLSGRLSSREMSRSTRSTRSSRWTAWDSEALLAEGQKGLMMPVPMPVYIPGPLGPAAGPGSASADAAAAARPSTARSSATVKALRLSVNRAKSQFLSPLPSPMLQRLSRGSDGTFGGAGRKAEEGGGGSSSSHRSSVYGP